MEAISAEERAALLGAYAAAVGRVAYEWNSLVGQIGWLFATASGMEQSLALAVYYSTENDRAQLLMFKAIIVASINDRWLPRLPKAKEDLARLVDRAFSLHDKRNNVIHTPCIAMLDDRWTPVIGAAYFTGHTRAKRLHGKDLLVEFDWCERWAAALSTFGEKARDALRADWLTWPERPEKPIQKRKADFPSPLRQPREE